MFDNFETDDFAAEDDVRIHFVQGGDGPPLLLLHGYPMTHAAWAKEADQLAERYRVVAPDLRGYGDSTAPPPGENHENYSFRAMASDQVQLMASLGHEEFFVAGHDRGARVVHRMSLDHPDRVRKAAVLDIVPTHYLLNHTSLQWAVGSWHWPFMAQEGGLPERLMGSVPPEWFLERKLTRPNVGLAPFPPEIFDEFVRCFTPKTIMASCEDYRASMTCDFALDTEDYGHKVEVPLLVHWGVRSHTEQVYGDVLGIWRDYAHDVVGGPLDSGHYVPLEAPDQVLASFFDFFTD